MERKKTSKEQKTNESYPELDSEMFSMFRTHSHDYNDDIAQHNAKIKAARDVFFTIAPYVDVSCMSVQEIDLYGDIEGIEDVILVDEPVSVITPPPVNDNSVQNALLSVVGLLNIQSLAYLSTPKFYPYNRQHKMYAEVGQLYLNCAGSNPVPKECDLYFPSVGYEYLSAQYKNNIGIFSDDGVVALNVVSNVIYDFKCVPEGPEFIVFEARCDNVSHFFLWDDDAITEVDSTGVSYGIRCGSRYCIIDGAIFYKNSIAQVPLTKYMVTEMALNFMTSETFLTFPVRGLLFNMNGIDYMVPTNPVICLQNVNGKMIDAQDTMPRQVDIVVEGCGLYEICKDCYRYCRGMVQLHDNPTSMFYQAAQIRTVKNFLSDYKIPRGSVLVSKGPRQAAIVANKAQFIIADRQGFCPFYKRSVGLSKNAAVGRYVERVKMLPSGMYDYVDYRKEMYVGNNRFFYRTKRKMCVIYFHNGKMIVIVCDPMSYHWVAVSRNRTHKYNYAVPIDPLVMSDKTTFEGIHICLLTQDYEEMRRLYDDHRSVKITYTS